VAQRIITRVFGEIQVSRILLAVSKLNPPIGGDVEAVTVELENTVKPIANTTKCKRILKAEKLFF
jgi:dihydroneopterin aldolase